MSRAASVAPASSPVKALELERQQQEEAANQALPGLWQGRQREKTSNM
jgi:hypothetical protein